MRCLDHSEIVTCEKCSPIANVITLDGSFPKNITNPAHDFFTTAEAQDYTLGYRQGRKDAIDEVLGLLRKDLGGVNFDTLLMVADWLEGKISK